MDEHVFHRPGAELRPFVGWCTGYRQAGVPAARHRGLHTSPALITHEGRQSGIQLGLTPLGGIMLGSVRPDSTPGVTEPGAF